MQALLLMSECINSKNTFQLINRALLASVPTSLMPVSEPIKIIVMKLKSGSHNVS
jgi:hypothetical protein